MFIEYSGNLASTQETDIDGETVYVPWSTIQVNSFMLCIQQFGWSCYGVLRI